MTGYEIRKRCELQDEYDTDGASRCVRCHRACGICHILAIDCRDSDRGVAGIGRGIRLFGLARSA
jgi:hypothetical protein